MGPACTVLVHRLRTARKQLLSIRFREAERIGRLLMSEFRGNTVRILDKEPQQWLDELIVRRDAQAPSIAAHGG